MNISSNYCLSSLKIIELQVNINVSCCVLLYLFTGSHSLIRGIQVVEPKENDSAEREREITIKIIPRHYSKRL